MKNVQTKKDEVISVVTQSEDLVHSSGKFISKAITKGWTEDFIDEDTSEVVQIERKEILFDEATAITPTLISQLLFYLQSGEVKEIEISNQRRAAYESSYGSRIYLAVAEIGPKLKKTKFLFAAPNIPISIEILKDYIELNFIGGYRIVSIKEFQTSLVLDDNMTEVSKLNAPEEAKNDEKFYHITAIVTMKDGYETKANVVVKTLDLDKALILLNKRLSETYKEEEFTSKLEEAKLLTVDHIIEDDFVLAYKN